MYRTQRFFPSTTIEEVCDWLNEHKYEFVAHIRADNGHFDIIYRDNN